MLWNSAREVKAALSPRSEAEPRSDMVWTIQRHIW